MPGSGGIQEIPYAWLKIKWIKRPPWRKSEAVFELCGFLCAICGVLHTSHARGFQSPRLISHFSKRRSLQPLLSVNVRARAAYRFAVCGRGGAKRRLPFEHLRSADARVRAVGLGGVSVSGGRYGMEKAAAPADEGARTGNEGRSASPFRRRAQDPRSRADSQARRLLVCHHISHLN